MEVTSLVFSNARSLYSFADTIKAKYPTTKVESRSLILVTNCTKKEIDVAIKEYGAWVITNNQVSESFAL